MEQSMDEYVVWSLFSGAAGLDLGLEQAGLPPSLAVDIDPLCCQTIRLNRPDLTLIEADVRTLRVEDLKRISGYQGEVYVLAGGPPCQSFSPGGNRASLRDPRGNLIYEFFRLVGEVRPRYFLFENVANLVTAALRHRPIANRPGKHWNLSVYETDRTAGYSDALPMREEELSGSAIRALLGDVATFGYRIEFGILDAADYGAAQHRLRFVMVGSREGPPPKLPSPTHGAAGSGRFPWVTLRDAIYDLRLNPGRSSEYSEEYKRIFSRVPPGGHWRDLPPSIQRKALGASFESGGGKTGFFRRLSWDTPAPTITGKPNRKGAALCHPEFLRPLSARECARIQGFPHDWQFAGSMHQQYRQIGDAVPVQLGKALGSVLLPEVPLNHEAGDIKLMLDSAVRRLRSAGRNKRTKRLKELVLD